VATAQVIQYFLRPGAIIEPSDLYLDDDLINLTLDHYVPTNENLDIPSNEEQEAIYIRPNHHEDLLIATKHWIFAQVQIHRQTDLENFDEQIQIA
jgi:hypothetical protein